MGLVFCLHWLCLLPDSSPTPAKTLNQQVGWRMMLNSRKGRGLRCVPLTPRDQLHQKPLGICDFQDANTLAQKG